MELQSAERRHRTSRVSYKLQRACVSPMHCNLSNNSLRYPAGFVYIYSFLYYVTGQGSHIVWAQAIFALLYLSNLAVVMRLYSSVAMVSA